jgi:hypothetical protein
MIATYFGIFLKGNDIQVVILEIIQNSNMQKNSKYAHAHPYNIEESGSLAAIR